MPEIDNVPAKDPTIWLVAQAKCGDACIMADSIVRSNLDIDRSREGDELPWEATWTSEELQKRFELSVLINHDGSKICRLGVSSTLGPQPVVTYGFESEYYNLTVESEGADSQEYSPTDDPSEWRYIEATLRSYLKSAPGVQFESLPTDSEWRYLFHDMMVFLALEDNAVKAYRRKYDTEFPDNTKRLAANVIKRIQHDYDLPEDRAKEVLNIVEQQKEQ